MINWKRGVSQCCMVFIGLSFTAAAEAQYQFFTNFNQFEQALGQLGVTNPKQDTFDSYSQGPLHPGSVLGDFSYHPKGLTHPGIEPEFEGPPSDPSVGTDTELALGDKEHGVFVGNDYVRLGYIHSSGLSAFGADFFYAPSGPVIPADTYRLGVGGSYVGNSAGIPTSGGDVFLGVIADPGTRLHAASLYSVQTDPTFLVPAYQVERLVYAQAPTAVPESGADSFYVFAIGGALILAAVRRRRVRMPAAQFDSRTQATSHLNERID